jgi:hypothetical protein
LEKDWVRFERVEDAVQQAALLGISLSDQAKLRGYQVDVEEMEQPPSR